MEVFLYFNRHLLTLLFQIALVEVKVGEIGQEGRLQFLLLDVFAINPADPWMNQNFLDTM